MRPNYKALAAYYRKRFLQEGSSAAVYHTLYARAEKTIEKQDEEIKGLRDRNAQLEAEVWTRSQTV